VADVLDGEHSDELAPFDDGQRPKVAQLQEPVSLPEEVGAGERIGNFVFIKSRM
jgi:hypothetical protein